ncbi:MAG: acyl-CoA dehydratase activase [bacterium]|nr:acyl-CoA dehydratase activase [bacterium]
MKTANENHTTPKDSIYLGLDLGSISLNTVILDNNENILENFYDHCHGQPFLMLRKRLSDLLTRYEPEQFKLVAITGTGGKLATELIGGQFINEIIAQSKSVSKLYPQAKTIIEMGGEDSKLIFMNKTEGADSSSLSDFNMNSICAAGTGSFLDQQAKRIGVSIENEFGALAMQSAKPPHIAGRCSVFAKSDMIHLQQIATPVHDIVAGLCFAVARNFKSNLARGKELIKPIVFQGGVAANAGVVHAFMEILNLKEGELIIPQYHASMGALGAIYYVRENPEISVPFKGTSELESYLLQANGNSEGLPMLKESAAVIDTKVRFNLNGHEQYPVYLGIDVGSLSTNVVLIDEFNNVIARKYLPTASRPLDAIKRGLQEIYDEVGAKVDIKAAGTTGSGRYLTGDFIGADVIQNEITAQATAAIAHDPTVDTIFEIGGQDSKFISIENGVVVDFDMNKVCAAGTGSFLEEQAEKLDINIVEEFGTLALGSEKPTPLGCRCTVFIESDLNANQQRGEKNSNLVGGLAYSIVNNYIQRVVGSRKVGNKIFFQGGVANNKGVVAAFEQITGKPIIIPPNFDVTGAIGMAILAREKFEETGKTKFKGFDVRNASFSLEKFTCKDKDCHDLCEIRMVKVKGEKKPFCYGGRCEKYEMSDRKNTVDDIPNLFEERERLLLGDYLEETNKGSISIGIPRELLLYYQEFPFWRTFFTELGFQVVLSKHTDRALISKSLSILNSETCLPIECVHGHIVDLLTKNVDYVFTPFIVNAKKAVDNPTSNCNCPWIQLYPFMVKAALDSHPGKEKLLSPSLHPRYFDDVFIKEMADFMKQTFGTPGKAVKKALYLAQEKQLNFEKSLVVRGNEILTSLPEGREVAVILGRTYNTGDPELNLRLVEKLIHLNVLPFPLDFLPLAEENIFEDFPNMYWPGGRKILAGAKIIARTENMYGVYTGNFRCGPDSFISHFVTEVLKGKPSIQIEIDEHSADAGLITRLEAFLDSVRKKGRKQSAVKRHISKNYKQATPTKDRVLYWPYMHDGSYIAAAAARSCGIESYALPLQTNEDLELGRKYTSAKECFPMICTTGSFIKKLQEPGVDPKKVSFFMPDHNGPCRFGMYNQLQKIIFDRLNLKEVKIVTPSNDGSYSDITPGNGSKFRMNVWKGFVAFDLIRKLQQQYTPYEKIKGDTEKVYLESLNRLVQSVENNTKNLGSILEDCGKQFKSIQILNIPRKPVVAVVGEIFMRDNKFCSGNIVKRLEALGAETLMAPFSEWFVYSTYRYNRDSKWKKDYLGVIKSKIQEYAQHASYKKLFRSVEELVDADKEISLETMLDLSSPYVHRDYDGDPVMAIGSASALGKKGVAGVCNVLPFTCMPGTLICSVSDVFRKDHNNIPWVDYTYDGQEDASIETRLQAFMFQVKEYHDREIGKSSRSVYSPELQLERV